MQLHEENYVKMSQVCKGNEIRTKKLYLKNKIAPLQGLKINYFIGRLPIGILYFWLLMPFHSSAQDVSFSQFYASPIYLNPAFSGIHRANKLSIHYRNQYRTLESYTTYGVSFDKYFEKLHGGLGLQLLKSDQASAVFQTVGASLAYAYQTAISKKYNLQAGLQVGYQSQQLAVNKLTVLSQIDPFTGSTMGSLSAYEQLPTKSSIGFLDIGTGAVLYNSDFYVGISAKHLNQPETAYGGSYKWPMAINLHAGYQFHDPSRLAENSWYITPTLQLNKQQNFKELNLGFFAGIKNIFGGLAYRNTFKNADAIVFLIGLGLEKWRIGYSFDYNVATKYNVPRTTHELTLSYLFSKNKKGVDAQAEWSGSKSGLKRMKCPKFFK
jgi:type IX secretion system PorP/SprF family membrane protein